MKHPSQRESEHISSSFSRCCRTCAPIFFNATIAHCFSEPTMTRNALFGPSRCAIGGSAGEKIGMGICCVMDTASPSTSGGQRNQIEAFSSKSSFNWFSPNNGGGFANRPLVLNVSSFNASTFAASGQPISLRLKGAGRHLPSRCFCPDGKKAVQGCYTLGRIILRTYAKRCLKPQGLSR